MTQESFSLQLNNYKLNGLWFLPDQKVTATALLIHGQGDFTQRYKEVANLFCAHGIAICGVDLPGHGKSSGKRGDIPSLKVVDEVLKSLHLQINNRFPNLDRGILAHSMGGHLALRELIKQQNDYAFAWISSPLLNPRNNKPAWEISILSLLAKITPKLTISTGVKRDLCRRIPEKVKTTHKKNPLFHKKISLRWGYALLESTENIRQEVKNTSVTTPTLLTQGAEDRITPKRFAQEFTKTARWPQLTCTIIPNALHEPFRDFSKEQCFQAINQWLDTLDLKHP